MKLVSHIPLYNQVIPWAGSKKVEIIHRDGQLHQPGGILKG